MKRGYNLFENLLLDPDPDKAGGSGGSGGGKTAEEIAAAKKIEDDAAAAKKKKEEDDLEDDPGKQSEEDFDKLPDWAKKKIKDLRKESGDRRTKNKDLESRISEGDKLMRQHLGIEDPDADPAEKIQGLSDSNANLEFRNAILNLALENEVPNDKLDYFEFLMAKEAEKLKDDEEMTDEQINVVLQKAKGLGKGAANSSVDGDGGDGGQDPDPKKKGTGVTLEEFGKMNILEKSDLYAKKPDEYETLMKQAKAKGLI